MNSRKIKSILVTENITNHVKLRSDWTLYDEILFHIVANAVKFNRRNGSVTIRLIIKNIGGSNFLET